MSCIDQLMKIMKMIEVHRNLIMSRSNSSVLINSEFIATILNTATMNNKGEYIFYYIHNIIHHIIFMNILLQHHLFAESNNSKVILELYFPD